MEKLETILNLVKDAGYKADYNMDNTKINIYNKKDELIGQMGILGDNKPWFFVFDIEQDQITPEGGQFDISVTGVTSIIEEFRYR